jgi:inorganic pyrophosphatase
MHKDFKILGVPTSHVRGYNSLKDIDPMFLEISKNFFLHYKELNNKRVKVFDWYEKQKAFNVIKKSIKINKK